jgi:hypothetical protein
MFSRLPTQQCHGGAICRHLRIGIRERGRQRGAGKARGHVGRSDLGAKDKTEALEGNPEEVSGPGIVNDEGSVDPPSLVA